MVVYPIIYKALAPSKVVGLGISEPSTVPCEDLCEWSPNIFLRASFHTFNRPDCGEHSRPQNLNGLLSADVVPKVFPNLVPELNG